MPSQCGPSFYSYGHRLTLVGDNRGALPLAPARALSSPHPSLQSYFQNNNTAGGGGHECVCLICWYACVSLVLGMRFINGSVNMLACVRGSTHAARKATVCAHICVCCELSL